MSKPRVIAVANQKGGTGKSTITVNVAAALGADGLRVLVVDVDSQADATSMFGVDPAACEHTLYDVLTGNAELPAAIATDVTPGVDLVVGDERLADVEIILAGATLRERYLSDALKGNVDAYDLVLLDCPPKPQKCWSSCR
jgi:chromosome partitioning protein